MRLTAIALLLILLALPAAADTVSYPVELPLTYTDIHETLALPQFDPVLGVLQAVEVTFDAGMEGAFLFENTGAAAGGYYGSIELPMLLTLPDGTNMLVIDDFIETEGELDAFDGTLDFDGPSGTTDSWTSDMDELNLGQLGEDLAFFEGTGTVDLELSTEVYVFLQMFTGSGSMGSQCQAWALATVTYTYEGSVAVGESSWSRLKTLY